MLATPFYQGHGHYLHSQVQAGLPISRSQQQHAPNPPADLFAHTGFAFDPTQRIGAVSSASFAVSSGGGDDRREAPAAATSGLLTQSYAPERDVDTRSRASLPPAEETAQQPEGGDPAPAAPTKKKRTRTLTTSHQSSVLLALLAKTPFPTTAEREEVGRRIGLTARKVQVWFQNQRQKQKKASQSGTSVILPQGATTSAPLPLSHQPGFSALHAARMGVGEVDEPLYQSSPVSPHQMAGNRRTAGSAYDTSPPTQQLAPSRSQPSDSYHTGTTLPAETQLYYSLGSGTSRDVPSYPQTYPLQPAGSSSGDHSAAQSNLSQAFYGSELMSEPFTHLSTHSRGPSGQSYTFPPPSQPPSVSDEQSRPTTSRGSQQHQPQSLASPATGSWRFKPLPPLPPESVRPSTGQSSDWDQQSSDPSFRVHGAPPRGRAFSNPGTRQQASGQSGPSLPNPVMNYSSESYHSMSQPLDPAAPAAYLAPSDYQRLPPTSSPTPTENLFSFRYDDPYSSPTGVSPSSSLSYADMGLQSQHSAPPRASYSPQEHRRSRLSYDSSVGLGGQQAIGKRSWSTDEGRPTKRARTDEGHVSVSLRRPIPPSSYQPPATAPDASHRPPSQLYMPPTGDPQHPYHYAPPSDSFGGT